MKRRRFLESAALGAAAAFGLPGRPVRARGAPRGPLERAGVTPAIRLARYDGAHAVGAVDLPVVPGRTTRGEASGAAWSCALRATPVKSALKTVEAVDLIATFKVERGAAREAAVGLGLAFSRWSRGDYVVLPGAVYAGNRFESRHIAYPPKLSEAADIGPHVPPIVSDIPRLNVHPGPSRLQVLASDLATPAFGVHLADDKLGVLVLVEPATRVGLSSLTLEESDDRTSARLVLGAPGVREDVAYAAGSTRLPSKDRGATFRAGDTLALKLRVHVFECAEPSGLFEVLAAVCKDLVPSEGAPTADSRPFSAAFKAHEERVNRRFVETSGIYSLDPRPDVTAWQSGWCGGLATTLPLLLVGTPDSRARAKRTLAFLFKQAQAPSGFFRSSWDGERWSDDGPPPAREAGHRAPAPRHAGRWHLTRRSADALTFAAKQLLVMRRQDPATKLDAAWLAGLGRAADAFVRLWDRERQLGQYVDVETGELIVGGSTSAGLAPAGLALAASLLKRDEYLVTAHAAGEQYYDKWVRAGLTCGGPGDALQCPDGESAAALLESFVTLFEQTNDKVWLERATAAARLAGSWVISYAYPDRERTTDVVATGAVLSDAQNGRGSPGYIQLSGDALLRLYRATGDASHLQLLADTARGLVQYLPLADRADQNLGGPAATPPRRARADTTGWLDGTPDVMPATSVFDTSALLSYAEIPSVYVRTTSRAVHVFDHLLVKKRADEAGRLVLSIENPSKHDATARVLAESDEEAARPLGPGALLGARVVAVPAGETVEVALEEPAASGG